MLRLFAIAQQHHNKTGLLGMKGSNIHISIKSFFHYRWQTILGVLCFILGFQVSAQDNTQTRVTEVFSNQKITEVLHTLEQKYPVRFFYPENQIPENSVTQEFHDTPILDVVKNILDGTNLGYMTYGSSDIIIGDMKVIGREFSSAYYQAMENPSTVPNKKEETSIVVGSKENTNPNGSCRLTILLTSADNGEVIPGVHIVHHRSGEQVVSDEHGLALLNIPVGNGTLTINSMGFNGQQVDLSAYEDGKIEISMSTKIQSLNEVVILANGADLLKSNDIGAVKLDVESIKRVPAFLGEPDVIKSLEMQAGVTTAGEGSGGFNVRGGNADHNLILMDQAPLYNTSHLLGFYSSLNYDLIKESTFYKGFVPSRFGGRLSSVLSIDLRDGDFKNHQASGSLGVVGTSLVIDGPIIRNRSSFLIGGRVTYANSLLRYINNPDVQSSATAFYDVNGRFVQKLGDYGQIGFSTYLSKDDVNFANNFGFAYQTAVLQLDATYSLGNRLSGNSWLVYSDYEAVLEDIANPSNVSSFTNGIGNIKFKQDFQFSAHSDFEINAGAEFVKYDINSGQLKPLSETSTVETKDLQPEQSLEYTGYAEVQYDILPKLSILSGVRFTHFQNIGTHDVYTYGSTSPDASDMIDTVRFENGEKIASYSGWEPRISLNWEAGRNVSVKMGYSRLNQYVFQLSNTAGVSPVDIWKSSDNYFQPQSAHQYSVGLYSKMDQGKLLLSVESYYKTLDHLVDYRPFADLIANDHLETETLFGIGRAYGVELVLTRTEGQLNGSLAYTYSRSERQMVNEKQELEINNGNWYPANYDRPHVLTLNLNYDWSKRHRLSVNFNYSTGRPTTAPVGYYNIYGEHSVPIYSPRNAERIPDYHRLDLAYSILPGYKKSRKIKGTWIFSIYNVYGRSNAYSVFFTQSYLSGVKARKYSVLGSAFPSITYMFHIASDKNK